MTFRYQIFIFKFLNIDFIFEYLMINEKSQTREKIEFVKKKNNKIKKIVNFKLRKIREILCGKNLKFEYKVNLCYKIKY